MENVQSWRFQVIMLTTKLQPMLEIFQDCLCNKPSDLLHVDYPSNHPDMYTLARGPHNWYVPCRIIACCGITLVNMIQLTLQKVQWCLVVILMWYLVATITIHTTLYTIDTQIVIWHLQMSHFTVADLEISTGGFSWNHCNPPVSATALYHG